MKKSFFYLAAGALALTACTSEEVLDESSIHSNAIGFETVVNKQTRATEITNGTFDKFGVFGYYVAKDQATGEYANHGILVFNNESVTRDGDGSANWSYQSSTRYWVPDAKYYFYAYSCGGVKLNSEYGNFSMDVTKGTAQERAFRITNYICDNTHQHDLLFDKQEEFQSSNSTVKFKFDHILTKVDAKFFSDFAPEYEIEISDVKFSNIRNQGDYSSFDENWINQNRVNPANKDDEKPIPYVMLLDKEKNEAGVEQNKTIIARNGGKLTPEVGSTEGEEITPLTPKTDFAFVLPYTYTEDANEVTISFTAIIKKDGEVLLNRNLSGSWKPNWQKGYQYTYNIKIGGSTTGLKAIVFQTDSNAINNWADGTDNGALNNDTNTNTIEIKTDSENTDNENTDNE
ncbi:MAG: fimbrillin family protein [Bacteroidaceae bacterium]|nr:fimbrillin family protein [Bacteroidaceae bacterium]